MGESQHHADLVSLIARWVRSEHSTENGLSILIDSSMIAPERRPGRIGGFTPDVVARTVPASFVIIGEAKSYSNFFTPRTGHQIGAFIDYLRLQPEPLLIVATPLTVHGAARSLVGRLKRQRLAANLRVVFLYG